MTYNPFAPTGTVGDLSSRGKKMTKPRWPKLFNMQLSSLEWSNTDTIPSRKRTRYESETDSVRRSHNANAAHSSATVSNQTISRERKAAKFEERLVAPHQDHHSIPENISVLGLPPLSDDRVRYVVNFILEHVNSPNIEVEAKIGQLIEKYKSCRAVDLVPVLCETPLKPESNADTRFESDVGNEIFRVLNAEMNKRTEATSTFEHGRVQYIRTREIDVFHGNVRETKVRRDTAGSQEIYDTVRVQMKKRLGDLNVLCPGSTVDVRYSASLEQDAKIPPNSVATRQRTKDRISYKFSFLSVDITCVELHEGGRLKSTYEVEVEVDQTANLYGEVCKYRNGDSTSKLFEIAGALVNTVRWLTDEVRKASLQAAERH